MSRDRDPETAPGADAVESASGAGQGGLPPGARPGASALSLADLPVAGLTRRRIALLLGALVVSWVLLLFAHQVGQASDASARADAMRASNGRLQAQVSALQAELDLIQRQAYVVQQARAYRLGTPREIPFALGDDAPSLPADAPGSAGARLGSVAERPSPLDQWVRLLFGPGGDPSDPAGSPGS